jgi:hypothetical protein
MLFLLFALAGLILGLMAGGRLMRLTNYEFRGLPLLIGAAFINIAGGFFVWKVGAIGPAIRIVCLLAVYSSVAWVLWRTPGLWKLGVIVVTLGGLMNFLVMAANQGRMPVRSDLLPMAGKGHLVGRLERGQAFRHVKLTPETPLGFLGDNIPIGKPFSVPSPGDVVLALGIGMLAFQAVRVPQEEEERRLEEPSLTEA